MVELKYAVCTFARKSRENFCLVKSVSERTLHMVPFTAYEGRHDRQTALTELTTLDIVYNLADSPAACARGAHPPIITNSIMFCKIKI